VLAANKRDLTEQQRLGTAQIEAFAAELNIPHTLTSAKTGDEVEQLFRQLGDLMVE
jgi:Fe2+ transport system protein B